MKSLLTPVVGTLLFASLVVGSPARAGDIPCDVVAETLTKKVKFFESQQPRIYDGYAFGYGQRGDVSPNKFDQCLVEGFKSDKYFIKVVKDDKKRSRVNVTSVLNNFGGTTYIVTRKTE